MLTVNQLAKLLHLSDTAIRQWTAEFSDYLSAPANPPKGKPRRYSDDDYLIFTTVQVLRGQGVGFADIHIALNDGVRHEPLESQQTEDPPSDADAPGETAVTAMEAFSTTLQLYESRVSAYESRVQELTDKLIESETARAAAVSRLDVLEEQKKTKLGWWDRLLGRSA